MNETGKLYKNEICTKNRSKIYFDVIYFYSTILNNNTNDIVCGCFSFSFCAIRTPQAISYKHFSNAKLLLQTIQIHRFLTNYFQETFEGLFSDAKIFKAYTRHSDDIYIYEWHSCTAFVT